MKLRTFVLLVAVASVGTCTAANYYITTTMAPEVQYQVVEVPVTPAEPVETPAPTTPDGSNAAVAAGTLPNLRDVDTIVSGYVGKPLGSDKLKDVSAGQAFKVNVYQDSGSATANRAKVDLDRDEKWDEKWTFQADGTIQRQTSPNDDEQYTIKEVWRNGAWAPDAG